MTDPNPITPPPGLVRQWHDTTTMKTLLEIGTPQTPPDEVMVNGVRYAPVPEGPAVTSDPAPTADGRKPLWRLMKDVYCDPNHSFGPGCGFAAELRVVADWIERKDGYSPVLETAQDVATWLRAEADRAEAGER